MAILGRLLLLAGLGLIFWRFLRPRSDFVIRVHEGEVTVTGRIARARQVAIRDFFRRELSADTLTVEGRLEPTGRLVLRIRGVLDAGEHQRIRNFLTMTLA